MWSSITSKDVIVEDNNELLESTGNSSRNEEKLNSILDFLIFSLGRSKFLRKPKLYQISQYLFDAEFSLTNSERSDVKYDGSSMLELAYTKAPNMAIYEMLSPDSASNEFFSAYFNETDDNNVVQNYQGEGDDWINPVAQIHDAVSTLSSNRIRTKLGMQYQIIPKRLKLVTDLAYDINNQDERRFDPQSAETDRMQL